MSLYFTIKFCWTIIRHHLGMIFADNVLIWDRAVLNSSLLARYYIDFAK